MSDYHLELASFAILGKVIRFIHQKILKLKKSSKNVSFLTNKKESATFKE